MGGSVAVWVLQTAITRDCVKTAILDEAVRAQALRQAAEQARISADAIAAGLGVKVVRVLSAEEITPEAGVARFGRAMAAEAQAGAAPPTPLEVGMIEVTVRVMLRVEIGQ